MAFRWRADGVPLVVVFGPSHQLKPKRSCQSWTTSGNIFWIRDWTTVVYLFISVDLIHVHYELFRAGKGGIKCESLGIFIRCEVLLETCGNTSPLPDHLSETSSH